MIVIVSLAPWARRSPWWNQARLSVEAGLAPSSARLLLKYFAAPGNTTGACAAAEAAIIRGWASSVAHWKDRAEQGHFPLRFAAYTLAGEADSPAGGRPRSAEPR